MLPADPTAAANMQRGSERRKRTEANESGTNTERRWMMSDVEVGRLMKSERKYFICLLRTTQRQSVSEAVDRHQNAERPSVERKPGRDEGRNERDGRDER
jgi:hypothetical protein